jgi:phage shock protein PspC (stress-responsive transcriptional regulator)
MKNRFVQKLASRKLWMAIAGIATGLALVLGVDASEISNVAGAVTAVASVVTYIVTEGRIDAESVKKAVESVEKAVDTIGGEE